MDEWLNFYRTFFSSKREVEVFVEACEQLTPSDNTAKIMMHQGQRLISLSDDIPEIRPRNEALRLLFLLMCAENISKLHEGFQGEGQSRDHVRRFFDEFLTDDEKQTLSAGFEYNSELSPRLELREAIDILYDVRCNVVHEGDYWGFAFHDESMPMVNADPNVISYITFDRFRSIVVRGCIKAVQSRLPSP